MSQKSFRHDINALRALAVIAVVLYHFKVPFVSSGFIGVDIFFVISGFLMTSIICKSYESGQFNVWRFFFARAKRIIPALLVLCFSLMVLGYFLLLPLEYRQLSKHLVASLFFLSNIIFAREAGYFDSESSEKFLLHTWSLSVEWQFYLILPFIFLFTVKLLSKRRFPAVLMGLALLSLTYCLMQDDAQDVYFSLFTRSWEMILGGLVYFLPSSEHLSEHHRKNAALTLVLSLVLTVLVIGPQALWPNPIAVIPIVLTAGLLWLQWEFSFYRHRIVSYFGNVSYSWYLWHWPVAVFILKTFGEFTPVTVILGAGISLAIATASLYLVENPSRNVRFSFATLCRFSFVFFIVCTLSTSVFVTNGLPYYFRIPENVIKADLEYLNREPRKESCLTLSGVDSEYCRYGDQSGDVSLIVFGDSHASAVVTAVEDSLQNGQSVLFIAKAGCPPLGSGDPRKQGGGECQTFVEKQISYVQSTYPGVPILVVSRWAYYYLGKLGSNKSDIRVESNALYESFTSTWCSVAENRNVVALSPIPEYSRNVPNYVAKSLWKGTSIDELSIGEFQKRSGWVMDALEKASSDCSLRILDASKYLCDGKYCYIDKNGLPIYYDDNHLSEFGNKLLVPLFKEVGL